MIEFYKASPDDLPELVLLFDEYRQFYQCQSDLVGAEQFLKERLTKGESVLFIARATGGAAAGFIQLYPSFSSLHMRRIWILNDLFVRESYRRLGIAKGLMDRAKDFARLTGAHMLMLETAESNAPARSLYEAEEFTPVKDYIFYTYTIHKAC